MNNTKKRLILIGLCAFFNISIIFVILLIDRIGISSHIVQKLHMPATSIQGTLSALNMFLCVIMVFLHYDYGRKVAMGCIFLTILLDFIPIIISNTFTPLPAIVTCLISMMAVDVFSSYSKKITISSLTDFVTGIKNRRAFVNDLSDYLEIRRPFYLAYIDQKEIKNLNEIYGVRVGDYLVKTIANRLTENIEFQDKLYRVNGTSCFALIFNTNKNPTEKLTALLKKLNTSIEYKQDGESKKFEIDLLAGVVKFPEDGASLLDLTKSIDIALSYAKINHENCFVYSNKEIEEKQRTQLEAEKIINNSLENETFFMMYQPQFDSATKKLYGYEALLRSYKPNGSIIFPEEFITEAEKSDLILKIDDFVLSHTLNEFKEMLAKKDDISLSINISAKNMSNPRFAENLIYLINRAEFPAKNLILEINEYSLALSVEIATENINKLRELGVRFTLDNFGTGYTSIAQLLKLPIDFLKIDKSLIDDLEANAQSRELVDSVIYMGHTMKCKVISEGVETVHQLEILKNNGCDFIQGFVWGKPVDFTEILNQA